MINKNENQTNEKNGDKSIFSRLSVPFAYVFLISILIHKIVFSYDEVLLYIGRITFIISVILGILGLIDTYMRGLSNRKYAWDSFKLPLLLTVFIGFVIFLIMLYIFIIGFNISIPG